MAPVMKKGGNYAQYIAYFKTSVKWLCIFLVASGVSVVKARAADQPSAFFTIDVYKGVLPQQSIDEKGLGQDLAKLREGKEITSIPRVIHEVIPLRKSFDVDKEVSADSDEVVANAHVETLENGWVHVVFTQLGLPPAYRGATDLRLAPNERRILELPKVEKGAGSEIETLVVVSTSIDTLDPDSVAKQLKNQVKEDKDGHSRFPAD